MRAGRLAPGHAPSLTRRGRLGEAGGGGGGNTEQKHKQGVTSSYKAAATSSVCRLSSFSKQRHGFLWSCLDTQWSFSMQAAARFLV